jgi:hypothetical protein
MTSIDLNCTPKFLKFIFEKMYSMLHRRRNVLQRKVLPMAGRRITRKYYSLKFWPDLGCRERFQ